MSIVNLQLLEQAAQKVLADNHRGQWTVPSPDLYPHQWLWDSCFIAIGQRHYDTSLAIKELTSLLRGQWQNGMLPHQILTPDNEHWANSDFWQAERSAYAPTVATSGITQPPVLATAVLKVAEMLDDAQRQAFLKQMYPALIAYHRWLYTERDPAQSGLVALIHPWESGMDNSPAWDYTLRGFSPLWMSAFLSLRLHEVVNKVRKDTKSVPSEQRLTNIEALKFVALAYKLRKRNFDAALCLKHNRYAVEDVGFNSILIAANRDLQTIASNIAETIPSDLLFRFELTAKNLELMWDAETGMYYSRSFHNKHLIKIPTIASLLPLYAGVITKERADVLVRHLSNTRSFWPHYPVPTVPTDSHYYDAVRYWQGPTWINTNWLLCLGLHHYGYEQLAETIKQTSLQLISNHGFHEYFSALDGSGLGIDNFSWSAALCVDFLHGSFGSVAVEQEPANQAA